MAHDVFISYSSTDKAIADGVCASLESRRIRCWIAPRDQVAGASYAAGIAAALPASKVMVLVFSGPSNGSNHVARELALAAEGGVPIVPFRLADLRPHGDMAYFLAGVHWIDAITPPLEQRLAELASTVQRFLGAEAADRAITVGQDAPDPGAFAEGLARNREHLGVPTAGSRSVVAAGGSFAFHVQDFARADGQATPFLLAWHASLPRAFCVRHGMYHHYIDRDLIKILGVPTSDESKVVSSTGVQAAVQSFKVGDKPWLSRKLYYHLDGPLAGKAFYTKGGIHVRYLEAGAEASALGLPTTSEAAADGGAVSRFEGGEIRWWRAGNRIEVKMDADGGRRP